MDQSQTARAAAVFKDNYPVRWAGRQAVVVLPEHIGQANASQVSEQLLSVINRGAAALIVDMTATISCDYTGADALLRARHRAVASGTELRLAVNDRIVRRALSLSGLNHLISIYPSLEAAIAAGKPTAAAGTPELDDSSTASWPTVIASLSLAELTLRAALESSPDAAGPRIAEALRHLNDGIREIRDITLPRSPPGASPYAPPNGTPASEPRQAPGGTRASPSQEYKRRRPTMTDDQAQWSVAEWHGKMLFDRNGEKIGKLQDVYVDVETDEPQFATVKEGIIGRHLTFVPLGGIQVGPGELQVPVTKEQVRSAPDIEIHGDELSQADESTLYHHFELNYTPPSTPSGRRLARR
jgi:anti-anti-sigma factor